MLRMSLRKLSDNELAALVSMKTIDVTPTWKGILPALLFILADDSSTKKNKDMAADELRKMAHAADRYNEGVSQ